MVSHDTTLARLVGELLGQRDVLDVVGAAAMAAAKYHGESFRWMVCGLGIHRSFSFWVIDELSCTPA